MGDFSTIKRCADINETHVIQAAKTREDMRALLQHTAKISRPGEGASKVLLALARMAKSSSDWVDGDLRADFVAVGEKTDVDVKVASGGVIERLFPTFTLDAPLDEFVRAVRLVPRMIEPLIMHAQSDDHLVFVSSDELYDEPPPESVEIGDELEVDAETDFGSLNIVVGDAIPESEVERPALKGSTRTINDPTEIHRRKTVERMPAIGRDALRSDVPPATKKPSPKAKPKTVPPPADEAKPKPDDDFDEGWE